jgi:hypothetical protein
VTANERACTRVPLPNFNGKEGVSGSSPEEGSVKSRKSAQIVTLAERLEAARPLSEVRDLPLARF